MGSLTAIGQSIGVRVIEVAPEAAPRADRFAPLRPLHQWLEDVIGGWSVRRGEYLLEHDYEGLLRFVAASRRTHAWWSRPAMSLAQAEAMQTGAPGGALPASPTPASWFAPVRGEPRGFVLYVHGGSFISERSPKITALIGRFAAAANARVFAPSYRLAPEHPCPAAIEDIEAAFAWLSRVWPDEPVVAVAESSGSAILLSAIQRMQARGEPMPRGLMLLSPWVDLSLQSRSMALTTISRTATSSMEHMALMARLYARDRSTADPLVSPLYGEMKGLPPMLIHASKTDMLYDDAVRLAERIRDANGDLTLRLWTGEGHVWERTSVPAARQSIQLGAEFIRDRLAS